MAGSAGRGVSRVSGSADQRVPRQTEDAFGDLVAGDLGRAAGDRQGPGDRSARSPPRRRRPRRVPRPGRAGRPAVRDPLGVLGAQQLGHVALGPGLAADDGALRLAQVEQRDMPASSARSASDRDAASGMPGTASGGRARAGRSPKPPPAPPPMVTRSLPSVERATVQPSLTAPTTSSSGTKTSLKNTSLKIGVAGDLAQRAAPRRRAPACR